MLWKLPASEQISTAARNWEALKCNYGTCYEMPHYIWYWVQTVLSMLMYSCSAWTHLHGIIKKSNPHRNRLVLLTMLSTYRACQFHSRLHQCLTSSLLIKSVSAWYQWDQGQYQHPRFICQGLRLDRNPPHWMSPSPIGNGPHSRMRYVTWAAEVTTFPVCGGA